MDAKLVRLARNLGAKLYTNDYNLGKIAELQSVALRQHPRGRQGLQDRSCCPAKPSTCASCARARTRARASAICRMGRWSSSTTPRALIGQQVEVQVQSLLQTGAGVIVFADLEARNRRLNFRPRSGGLKAVLATWSLYSYARSIPADAELVRSRLEAAGIPPRRHPRTVRLEHGWLCAGRGRHSGAGAGRRGRRCGGIPGRRAPRRRHEPPGPQIHFQLKRLLPPGEISFDKSVLRTACRRQMVCRAPAGRRGPAAQHPVRLQPCCALPTTTAFPLRRAARASATWAAASRCAAASRSR